MPLAPNSILFAYVAGGPISTAATFTRASDASYRDRLGRLAHSTSNVPRLEWTDPGSTGVLDVPALLMERGVTNTLLHSEDFTQADWTKANVTATSDAAKAPDAAGSTNAVRIVESTDNGQHYIGQAVGAGGMTDNTLQAVSAFVAAREREWVYLESVNKAGATIRTWFNVSSGGIGTQNHTYAWLERWAEGYFRIMASHTAGSGAISPELRVALASSDGAASYAGSSTSGAIVWGTHFDYNEPEAGAYVPTSSASVSRADEALKFDRNFGVRDMTLYVSMERARYHDLSGSTARDVLAVSTEGPYLRLYKPSGSTSYSATLADLIGNTVTASAAIPASSAGALGLAVQVRNLNDDPQVRIDMGGGYGSWTSTGSLRAISDWGTTQVNIGNFGTGNAAARLYSLKVVGALVSRAEAAGARTAMGAGPDV